MFNIGASELLIIVIVAVLVIGPKDLPLALRTAGQWIGKVRRVSNHFRSGLDAMIREAEMEDMEKKWRDQNARIMAQNPSDGSAPAAGDDHSSEMMPLPKRADDDSPTRSEGAAPTSLLPDPADKHASADDEPMLPLHKPKPK